MVFTELLRAGSPHFLNGRTQCVVLDGVYSPRCPVLSGVPQGMVLGSALFSIYINDLPEAILHSSVKLFADDCTYIVQGYTHTGQCK